MNTKLEYRYRDAGNWKRFGEVVFSGVLSVSEIAPYLHDGEFFIPGELKMENLFPLPFGEEDYPWHEIVSLLPTDAPPTVRFNADELRERFRQADEDDWHEDKWTTFGILGVW